MKRVVEEITELDIQIGSLFEEGGTKGNYCKNYKIKSAAYKVIFNDVIYIICKKFITFIKYGR